MKTVEASKGDNLDAGPLASSQLEPDPYPDIRWNGFAVSQSRLVLGTLGCRDRCLDEV
jgi:hypothetical protein